jgi:hypothetical protein
LNLARLKDSFLCIFAEYTPLIANK